MGKTTCCVKEKVKRGPWSPDEDQKLVLYIKKHGHGSWRSLPKNAGLLRCGKSCRLRWLNYLHPDIKRGPFAPEEQATIIQLQGMLGNKWASIASHLPGRTDNEIKNFWNTHLRKRLCSMGRTLQTQLSPFSAEPSIVKSESPSTHHMVQWESLKLEAEACLSMQSSLLYSPLPGKTDCDIFLQFWNSEVGERFRKIPRKDGVACQIPISLTSSSIKVESGSVVTVQSRPAGTNTSADSAHEQEDSRRPDVDMMACSVSTTSNDFADSSDTALKLLLDFPGGNDMEFLQGQTDAFSNFLDLGCD